MPLADLVRDVARKREALMEARRVVEIRTAYFEEENADVFDALNVAKIEKEEAEDALRAAVLAASEEEVKATDGVGIRNVKRFDYSSAEALVWAVDNRHYGMLSLNAKKFEKAAEALDLPGFRVRKEPQATIDRDLSGVLG